MQNKYTLNILIIAIMLYLFYCWDNNNKKEREKSFIESEYKFKVEDIKCKKITSQHILLDERGTCELGILYDVKQMNEILMMMDDTNYSCGQLTQKWVEFKKLMRNSGSKLQ